MAKIPIVSVYDQDGNRIEVPAIVGRSAYQSAQKLGYTGSEEEWIESLRGKDGRGIKSIVRTEGDGTPGTTDTYTITYTDNESDTFTVHNGIDRAFVEEKFEQLSEDKYREYLRAFFGWCYNEGYCERNPAAELRKIRYETKPREGFSQTELEYIRQACRDRRDLAIIEVLYSTGCRVSELCCLKKSDIDWGNKTVHLFGKGRKHRNSYLNAKAEVTLREYLNHRTDESEYLFVTKRGSHEMTPAAVQKVLRDLGKTISDKVGKRISPHIFRHTTATTALRNGMPLEDIQALLGHENIETTLVYAKTSAETVQMNHRRYII